MRCVHRNGHSMEFFDDFQASVAPLFGSVRGISLLTGLWLETGLTGTAYTSRIPRPVLMPCRRSVYAPCSLGHSCCSAACSRWGGSTVLSVASNVFSALRQ